MTEEPTTDDFEVPAQILPRVIGSTAMSLLSDRILLLFDQQSGVLISANDTAQAQLGLDLENAILPTFAEMVGPEEADSYWNAVLAGEDSKWTGNLTGALNLNAIGKLHVTACADSDGAGYILLQLTPEAPEQAATSGGGEESPISSAMSAAIGTILYDNDGNILSLNDRAMTAMEDYGEELVGRNHDTIWPKAECESESYFEFWEKLRNGRSVEGRHLHITAVESEVWFHSTFVPIKDGSGHVQQILQCLMDVSESAHVSEKAIERSQAVWDHVPMCEFDKDGHISSINQLMADILGHEHDDLIGKHDHDFCDKGFARGTFYAEVWEKLAEGKTQRLRIRHRNQNHEIVWMQSTLIPIMDPARRMTKVVKIGEEVTKEHEDNINYSALINASEEMIGRVEFDASGHVIDSNKNFRKQFQLAEDEARALTLQDLFAGPMRNDTKYRNFWDKMHEGTSILKTDELKTRDGETVYLKSVYCPLFTPNGNFWKMVMFFVDVTRSRVREVKLGERMRAINRTQLMIEYSADGTVLDVNDKYLEAFGYSEQEVKGRKLDTFYAAEAKETDQNRKMWERLRNGDHQVGEFRHRSSDGDDIWLQGAYSPILDPKQDITSIILFATDVTAEKLMRLETHYRLEALNTLQAVVEFDTSGSVIKANDAFLTTFGYSLREVVGQHHSMFCSPDYIQTEDYRSLWSRLAKGEKHTGRVRRVGRFNRDVHLFANYHPVRDIDGEVKKIIKCAFEISSQVELERTLTSSAEEISNKLVSGSDATNVIRTGAEELTQATRRALDSSRASQSDLEKTLNTLNEVSGEVSNLTEIVEAVGEIAVQTNLLAFNAAIEAARAGDLGIGFSIVADEVRKLAERNGEAARSIGRHIDQAKTHITTGTTTTQTILKDMGQQSDAFEESSNKLQQIIARTAEQASDIDAANQIATALKSAASQ